MIKTNVLSLKCWVIYYILTSKIFKLKNLLDYKANSPSLLDPISHLLIQILFAMPLQFFGIQVSIGIIHRIISIQIQIEIALRFDIPIRLSIRIAMPINTIRMPQIGMRTGSLHQMGGDRERSSQRSWTWNWTWKWINVGSKEDLSQLGLNWLPTDFTPVQLEIDFSRSRDLRYWHFNLNGRKNGQQCHRPAHRQWSRWHAMMMHLILTFDGDASISSHPMQSICMTSNMPMSISDALHGAIVGIGDDDWGILKSGLKTQTLEFSVRFLENVLSDGSENVTSQVRHSCHGNTELGASHLNHPFIHHYLQRKSILLSIHPSTKSNETNK